MVAHPRPGPRSTSDSGSGTRQRTRACNPTLCGAIDSRRHRRSRCSSKREALLRTTRTRSGSSVSIRMKNPAILTNPRRDLDSASSVDQASIEDPPTLEAPRLARRPARARTHAKPPRAKGEFSPRARRSLHCGERDALDVVVSFADEAIFLKGGGRLGGFGRSLALARWGRLAHRAFPAGREFSLVTRPSTRTSPRHLPQPGDSGLGPSAILPGNEITPARPRAARGAGARSCRRREAARLRLQPGARERLEVRQGHDPESTRAP